MRTAERVRWVWAGTAESAEHLAEVAEGHTCRSRYLAVANSHGLKLAGDTLWRVNEKRTIEAVPDGEATTEPKLLRLNPDYCTPEENERLDRVAADLLKDEATTGKGKL